MVFALLGVLGGYRKLGGVQTLQTKKRSSKTEVTRPIYEQNTNFAFSGRFRSPGCLTPLILDNMGQCRAIIGLCIRLRYVSVLNRRQALKGHEAIVEEAVVEEAVVEEAVAEEAVVEEAVVEYVQGPPQGGP